MVIIAVLNIISYRVAFEYFGKDLFGVYALLTTLTGYLILANFGIPTAATTLISGYTNKLIQKYIINYSFLLLMSLSVILFSTLYFIDLNLISKVLNIDAKDSSIFTYCLFIALLGVSIKLPFQLYQSIYLGNQKIAIVRFFDIVLVVFLNLILYFSAIIKIEFKEFFQIYTIFTIILTILFFFISYKDYIQLSTLRTGEVRQKIYSLSIGFFLLSLPVTFGWTIDNLIISSYLGVGEVASYAFSTKIYMLGLAFVSIVPNTLFSFYMRHKITNGMEYILKLQSFSLIVLRLFSGLFALIIFSLDEIIIKIWSKSENVYAGHDFSLVMSFYVYATALVNLHSSFLTGTLNVKKVTYLSYIELIIHISLSVLLVKHLGLIGIGLAMCISSFAIPYIILPKIIDKLSGTSFLNDNLRHLALCFLPSILLIYVQRLLINSDNLNIIFTIFSLLFFVLTTLLLQKNQFNEILRFISLSISKR
jgi:O-antigen/teichoic acid export membrane protein